MKYEDQDQHFKFDMEVNCKWIKHSTSEFRLSPTHSFCVSTAVFIYEIVILTRAPGMSQPMKHVRKPALTPNWNCRVESDLHTVSFYFLFLPIEDFRCLNWIITVTCLVFMCASCEHILVHLLGIWFLPLNPIWICWNLTCPLFHSNFLNLSTSF